MQYSKDNPIPPGTQLRLIRLWPHARRQGKENGQQWYVGEYSEMDGFDVIWLVDQEGDYVWTIDHEFLYKHFEVA